MSEQLSPLPSRPIADKARASLQMTTSQDESNFAAVKPNLLVPILVTGTASLEQFPGAEFQIRMRWKASEFRYSVEFLGITARDGIKPPDLHKYSIPTLIAVFASADVLVKIRVDDGDERLARVEDLLSIMDSDGTRAQVKRDGPTNHSLGLVAMLYAYARTIASNPNDIVVSVLELPKRTATRWIARARAEGLLD